MTATHRTATILMAIMMAIEPVQACVVGGMLLPANMRMADAVVIGRVSHYRVVRSRELPSGPKVSAKIRDMSARNRKGFLQYARFDVDVLEVLSGHPPKHFVATMYRPITKWPTINQMRYGYSGTLKLEVPENINNDVFIIGASIYERDAQSDFQPDSTNLPQGKIPVMGVLELYCFPSFMMRPSEGQVAWVRRGLKGDIDTAVPSAAGDPVIKPTRRRWFDDLSPVWFAILLLPGLIWIAASRLKALRAKKKGRDFSQPPFL